MPFTYITLAAAALVAMIVSGPTPQRESRRGCTTGNCLIQHSAQEFLSSQLQEHKETNAFELENLLKRIEYATEIYESSVGTFRSHSAERSTANQDFLGHESQTKGNAGLEPEARSTMTRSGLAKYLRPKDFEMGDQLGQSDSKYNINGTVFKACLRADNTSFYAIKFLEHNKYNTYAKFENEVEMLEKVQGKSPTIIRYDGWWNDTDGYRIVLEYAERRDLESLLRKRSFLEGTIRRFAQEIALAIQTVHEQNIIFRNLNLENVLLSNDGHIRLNNFGIAIIPSDGDMVKEPCGDRLVRAPIIPSDGDMVNFKERCGDRWARAPEMVREPSGKGYTKAVDWWSLGVLLYRMVVNDYPFNGDNQADVDEKILISKPSFPLGIKRELQSLIEWLLQKDPGLRPHDAQEFLDHEFFGRR